MTIVRIDEILLRRSASGLVRVIAPVIPAHEESALGRPFGFVRVNVPRTPQIDSLVAGLEATVKRAYSRGTLRPGQTPEQFFEETVGKVREAVAGSLAEEHIKIDPSLMTVVLACAAGSNVFITKHGRAEAYLIRRVPGYPTKTIDVFRGLGPDGGGRLLPELIVGTITPDDLLLIATDSLFEAYPIADLVTATDRSEPAAVAARIRSIILSAPGTEAVAGCLMRLAPVRAMFRAQDNPSVSALRSREEEVARTLSPSGIPGLGSFMERLKSKKQKPRKTSLPRQKKAPFIERFNGLPKPAKLAAITLLALVAVFIVSLKIVSLANQRQERDGQFAAAVESVKKQIDMAESTLIYDEDRAKMILGEAAAAVAALPGRTKREKEERTALSARLTSAERALQHRYDIAIKTIETQNGPASFILRVGNGWLINSGNDLVLVGDNGSPANLATLPDTPLWAALGDDNIAYLWLKNNTLVSLAADPKALPRALDYSGPENPRSGAIWNSRLYALSSDGKQVWKLPSTISGFGRGAAWLYQPIAGSGAPSIAIDGAIYAPVPGDAVRKFEKGNMAAFAASGASANADPRSIVLGATSVYLLGGDNTVAAWDKTGKLLAQYALPGDIGKATAFAVDEPGKKIVIVTDKGIMGSFEMSK